MKYFFLALILIFTATLCLWPNLHPEQAVLSRYYWQADVLIHSGYYFGLTLIVCLLKLKIKPVYLFLLLGLFSIALELLQIFSDKRGVSWMDGMDNLIGIVLAILIYKLLMIRYLKKDQFA